VISFLLYSHTEELIYFLRHMRYVLVISELPVEHLDKHFHADTESLSTNLKKIRLYCLIVKPLPRSALTKPSM
jgi:hypothetical protein